jgi:hypothetical protein
MIFVSSHLTRFRNSVLLATIRNNGSCPCPVCTVCSADVDRLGSVHDVLRSRRNRRVDDRHRQQWVDLARRWIFEDGYGITSKAVERILADKSWVPTRVRLCPFALARPAASNVRHHRMLSLRYSPATTRISMSCLFLIRFTTSNWGLSRTCSSITFVSCGQLTQATDF